MTEILMALELSEGNVLTGAQLMPLGEWNHPQGKIKVDMAKATRMATGFKRKLAGQRLPVFYIHSDKSNVANPLYGKAAGWMTDVRADKDRGVVIDIEFTEDGARAVRNKEFQYLSAEYFDKVQLPHHEAPEMDVLLGAALVNRPHLKGMQTILSEDVSLVFNEGTSKPDNPEGGGPVDPIVLALAKSAGLELSEDATELSAEERTAIEKHLQDESGKTADLEAKLTLLEQKLDGAEDGQSQRVRNLAEAGFEEEAKLLSEYRGEKLAKELAAKLPKGSELTPSVTEALASYAIESDPKFLHEALALMASGKGIVSLEEIGTSSGGGGNDTPGGDTKGASDKLISLAETYAKENEVSFTDAMDEVASEHPVLWKQHQAEMGSREVTG